MTIDEAIKGSEEAVTFLSIHHQPRLAAATKLTIEASKRFKELREVIRVPYTALLPGETKD